MLILSRKRGEKIVLPQCSVAVTVLEVHGKAVRLGISAPPEVAVHREEVWRELRAEEPDVAEAAACSDSRHELAAELSDAAYQSALRLGAADSWLEVELGLWRAMHETVKTLETECHRTTDQREAAHHGDRVELGVS